MPKIARGKRSGYARLVKSDGNVDTCLAKQCV